MLERINSLISQKDKAINERNQSIAAQAQMQQQYTQLQEQAQTGLVSATEAAQQAINRANMLEAQLRLKEAEAMRSQALLEKPHLAPYAQFIPATSNAEDLKAAIARLEEIRMEDMKRSGLSPTFTQSAPPSGTPPTPGQPASNPYAPFGGRATMNPSVVGPANPATMNPAGAGNSADAINQLFAQARAEGTPEAFELVFPTRLPSHGRNHLF